MMQVNRDIPESMMRKANSENHAAGTPTAGNAREAARRRIVRLVFVMFWLLMFEGAVRKWVVPRFSAYLYFVRDPVVLYVYFIALRHGLFMRPRQVLWIGVAIATVATLLGIVHLVGGGQYTFVLAAYGFRNYFLYLPLAFVIGECFDYNDLRRMTRHTLIAMIIAAPIAVIQFKSPAHSAINAGIATDREYQFENLAAGSGKIRPAGTFTSVMGMTQLTAACVAALMWSWAVPSSRRTGTSWLIRSAVLATATALAVSGSRTSFILSALVIITGMAITPFLSGATAKLRGFIIPMIVVLAFVFLFPIVYPEAFHTFANRWNDAQQTESQQFALGWVGRILFSFYDFARLLGQIPAFGYGIGTGGNGAAALGVSFHGVDVNKLAEEDWSRHVVELGPALAIVFIAYRIGFGIWLGTRSLRATLLSGDPLPVLLFAYCGVAIVEAQITGHGLVNGFGWLYTGFCLAAGNVMLGGRGLVPESSASFRVLEQTVSTGSFPNLMR